MPRLLIIILFFILAYYLLSKYVFPYLVRRFVRKTQDRFTQQFRQKEPPQSRRKEGEVEVKYVPPEAVTPQFNPDSTEDVDFEEIKDE
ncbi:MAG TPA: hypothetical protein VFC92_02215 [Bacteroidales bacterium]|nr:hypothetical protein [Bacteroidales bacterium]